MKLGLRQYLFKNDVIKRKKTNTTQSEQFLYLIKMYTTNIYTHPFNGDN